MRRSLLFHDVLKTIENPRFVLARVWFGAAVKCEVSRALAGEGSESSQSGARMPPELSEKPLWAEMYWRQRLALACFW